jgi:hypothetical protein
MKFAPDKRLMISGSADGQSGKAGGGSAVLPPVQRTVHDYTGEADLEIDEIDEGRRAGRIARRGSIFWRSETSSA